MKKILFAILALNYSLTFSQTDKSILKNDIKIYIKANNESDFETLVNYYPEFAFDSISKEKLINEYKKFYSNGNQTKIVMDTIFKIDTIISIKSNKYARIKIPQKTTMDLNEFKGENGMSYVISLYYQTAIMEYGEKNVSYKEGEWIFYIKSDKPTYGIKKNNQWTFTELNEETEKYIPIEIRGSEKNN
jgi:hypothetical protein